VLAHPPNGKPLAADVSEVSTLPKISALKSPSYAASLPTCCGPSLKDRISHNRVAGSEAPFSTGALNSTLQHFHVARQGRCPRITFAAVFTLICQEFTLIGPNNSLLDI
jgi:hypothetical protein